VMVKAPGEAMSGTDVELAVLDRPAGGDVPPYQRLLGDALLGDASLFTTEQGVEAAWTVVDPVLDDPAAPLRYAPGTWGPDQAQHLTANHGGWHDPAGSAT
jgi:glucose-6-phosphate 1-dehydrogenase